MKKLHLISAMIVATMFFACNNTPKNTSTEECRQEESKQEESYNMEFEPYIVKEVVPIDPRDKNSPALDISISLMLAKNANPQVAEKMNRSIAYLALGHEGMTPQEATVATQDIIKKEYMALRNDYINEKAADYPSHWLNQYYHVESEVLEGKKNTVCYKSTCDIFSGGAHPYCHTNISNFDQRTGEEITLDDLFTENYENELTSMLVRRLMEINGATSIEELQEMGYLSIADMFITNNFYLKQDSIVFLYNQYEIAPYALGQSLIGFSYKELKDLLK